MLFTIVTLRTLSAHDKISNKYLLMSYSWRGKLHATPTPMITITYTWFHTCQTKMQKSGKITTILISKERRFLLDIVSIA